MSAVADPYTVDQLRHPDPQNIGIFNAGTGGGAGLSGAGAPSPLLGSDGDTYVDTNSNGLYWKSNGQWFPQ